MKKLSKLTALAVSLVVASALAIIGCSDLSSSGEGTATQGYTLAGASAVSKKLTLNVSSDSDLIDFSTSSIAEDGARTVAPEAVDSTDLDFYLNSYDLIANANKSLTKVTFVGTDSSTTNGTVTVELDASNYRFTLVAVPTGTAVTSSTDLATLITKAYLIGYATADLRYTEEAASVNFILTSDSLSGSGKLKLDLYLDSWSAESLALEQATGTKVIAAATVGLYNIQTGAVISTSLVNPASFEGKTSNTTTFTYYGTTANTALTAIDSGTYDLTVTFTLKNGSKYIFSEPIIILPNQTTEATLPIPEVIGLPPTAPTNFKAGYIIPAYDDSDYYKVVFNWDDNSKNELYFELDLYDITSSTSITTASSNVASNWSGANYNTNTKTYANSSSNPSDSTHESLVFYGLKADEGPNWYAGSLNRNNKQAVFYIELGKRYLARIRAVNAAGDSAYAVSEVAADTYKEDAIGTTEETAETFAKNAHNAYCVPAATTYTVSTSECTAESATLSDAETKTAVKFNTEIIGLFRVKYELSGGAFTSPTSLNQVYYFDQLSAGNPIMQPDGVRTIGLAEGIINTNSLIYNGTESSGTITNAAITIKYGEGASAKPWTSWKVGSISGDTYESDYTACTTSTTYNPAETYYTLVNSSYAVTILTAAPTNTADWANYYTGTLKPYTGYENLVLYANYTSNTFGVTIKNVADYLIEQNLGIVATLSGTSGSTPKLYTSASDSTGANSVDVLKMTSGTVAKKQYLIISRTQDNSGSTISASNLVLNYSYNTKADNGADPFGGAGGTYEKVILEIVQQGTATGTSKGTYSPSGTTFTVPLSSFTTGTYMATFKAYVPSSNNQKPYEYTVYLQIND